MSLSDDQKNKLAKHLHETVDKVECKWCGKNKWMPIPHLVELREWIPNAIRVGGPTYPMAIIVCGNCGNTMLFSAVITGIIETKKGEKGEVDGTEP